MKTFIQREDYPIVKTKAGKLRGFELDGMFHFYGIQYATAKRFLPPKPVAKWEGVKEATSYGYIAPLIDPASPMGDVAIPHRFWPESEDCLYLNVWTKSLEKTAKKPVMVWLHGGGFSAGSSLEMVAYDGANLCDFGDVVVVTLNHRLNMLGYLDLSSFGAKYKNSGNAGMEDIVVALKWVRDNIAGFGGDPENVTIFGQSGGGMKVTCLGQIPEAYGLFHRMIVMSGVGDFGGRERRDDRKIALAMLEHLGLKEKDVGKLETLPLHDLFEAFHAVEKQLRKDRVTLTWEPIKNDWYLGDPLEVGFSDYAKTIPTMVGTVVAEFAAFGPGVPGRDKMTAEQKHAVLAERYGKHTDKVVELFRRAYPGHDDLEVLMLDNIFRKPTLRYIEEKSAVASAPVYSYMFALDFPIAGGKPAWHCADIPYVFHNTELVPNCGMPGISERVEEQVSSAYVNFARSGDPNTPALPEWSAFTPKNKATMVFDKRSELRVDYERELFDLLDKILPPFSLADMFNRADD